MISFIEGYNFQSWKHIRMDFSKGVNAIVGPSHSGKSVAVKLLVWVAFNRPWPLHEDKYRSDWGGTTKGIIGLDSGDVITRVKSDSESYYQINDGEKLEAFKSNVPEAVIALLNLTDINIQQQKDKHFLLASSAGEVARILNEAVDLEDIDKSLSFLKKKVKHNDMERSRAEKDLSDLAGRLTEFSHLNEMEAAISSLEIIEAGIKKDKEKLKRLKAIKDSEQEATDEINDAKLILSMIDPVEDLEEEWKLISSDIEMLKGMKKLQSRHDAVTKNINTNKIKLEKAEKEFHKLMPEECPLCGRE